MRLSFANISLLLTVYLSVITLIFTGCRKKNKSNNLTPPPTQKDSTNYRHKISYRFHEHLSPIAREKLSDEKNIRQLDNLMSDIATSSTGEALIESGEILQNMIRVKDSSKSEIFKRTDVKPYLRILQNEAARFAQMEKNTDLDEEVFVGKLTDVLSSYEMLVRKINNVYAMEQWEDQVKNDPDMIKAFSDFPTEKESTNKPDEKKKKYRKIKLHIPHGKPKSGGNN